VSSGFLKISGVLDQHKDDIKSGRSGCFETRIGKRELGLGSWDPE
jgi:hypothetical protein